MKFILILFTGALLLCTGCARQNQVYLSTEMTEYTTEAVIEASAGTKQKEELLYVYVCGAVTNPGVFSFEEGARVCDAIEEAGGFLENAQTESWNLAMILSDGMMIYVPNTEEESAGIGTENIQKDSEDTRVNLNSASKEQLMTLPGIGEAKADCILSFREENGAFHSVEEIMNVPGIKDVVYNKIKDYIRVN